MDRPIPIDHNLPKPMTAVECCKEDQDFYNHFRQGEFLMIPINLIKSFDVRQELLCDDNRPTLEINISMYRMV